jgi:hypothetical protein
MGRLPHHGQLGLLLFFKASLLLSQLGMLLRMLLRTFVFLLRFFVGCHRFLRTRSELKDNASDKLEFIGSGEQHLWWTQFHGRWWNIGVVSEVDKRMGILAANGNADLDRDKTP